MFGPLLREIVYICACRQLTQEYVPDAQSLQPYGLQVLLLASHVNVASWIYINIYIHTCVQLIEDTFLHVPILYLITTYSKSQFCTFYASCADSLAESCQGMGCQPQQRWPQPKGVCAPGAGSWMVHWFSMN